MKKGLSHGIMEAEIFCHLSLGWGLGLTHFNVFCHWSSRRPRVQVTLRADPGQTVSLASTDSVSLNEAGAVAESIAAGP